MTSQNLTYVKGIGTKTEIYIDVNFYWLILPIFTVTFALILLVVVIQQSREYGIPAWKSSQLETLRMLALEPRAVLEANKVQGGNLKVKLTKLDNGKWTLMEAQTGKIETGGDLTSSSDTQDMISLRALEANSGSVSSRTSVHRTLFNKETDLDAP